MAGIFCQTNRQNMGGLLLLTVVGIFLEYNESRMSEVSPAQLRE
jgi:hypothetical protein